MKNFVYTLVICLVCDASFAQTYSHTEVTKLDDKEIVLKWSGVPHTKVAAFYDGKFLDSLNEMRDFETPIGSTLEATYSEKGSSHAYILFWKNKQGESDARIIAYRFTDKKVEKKFDIYYNDDILCGRFKNFTDMDKDGKIEVGGFGTRDCRTCYFPGVFYEYTNGEFVFDEIYSKKMNEECYGIYYSPKVAQDSMKRNGRPIIIPFGNVPVCTFCYEKSNVVDLEYEKIEGWEYLYDNILFNCNWHVFYCKKCKKFLQNK